MVAYFHKLNYVFEILLYMIIENKMHVVEIFFKEGKFFSLARKKQLWEMMYFYVDLYEKIYKKKKTVRIKGESS